jgi:hypothetical protein
MANGIQWNWTARITGEPTASFTGNEDSDAHERASIPVVQGGSELEVTIAPGAKILAVSSSAYGNPGDTEKGIRIKVNEAEDHLALDTPLLLASKLVLDRFVGNGDTLKSLWFSNTLAKDVTITIFTLRDATPPKP